MKIHRNTFGKQSTIQVSFNPFFVATMLTEKGRFVSFWIRVFGSRAFCFKREEVGLSFVQRNGHQKYITAFGFIFYFNK